MQKKYDAIVFIGRFQPIHNAHVEIFRRATELANKVVMVIGSIDQPRTYKNPFTFEERQTLLKAATYSVGDIVPIDIVGVRDSMYNDQAWAAGVQEAVKGPLTGYGDNIAIIGHPKDNSSEYLKMFPQWKLEEVESLEPLHATNIRDLFFQDPMNFNFIKNVVPQATISFLQSFKKTDDWKYIIEERKFLAEYKKQYDSFPYPPVFVTVDNVVIQSGHVLMVKRKAFPGKGLWALPGGFLDAYNDRSVKDAALRELKEETGIKVPVPVLAGSITDNKVFDAIGRSARGRTITHAFKIELPAGELPKVKGQDDAEKAKWVPIAEIQPYNCFEDHWEIIQHFVGA